MNVLSLFDGMSCGRLALDKLGVDVENYFASEVDKYAIKVSEANYPDIIQLGDVRGVQYDEYALFHHQNDDPLKNGGSHIADIDLLIGGSPCQGFSFAGKQLNFEDPRSALFFEYVRLLKECKPKYFMLENVRMKKEYQDIISEQLGVQPVTINSSLVSAQNRVRLYWCGRRNDDGTYSQVNIPQPEDKGLLLRDIIEDGEADRDLNNLTQKILKVTNVNPSGRGMNGNVYDTDGKSPTLTTNKGEGLKITGGAMRGRYLDETGKRSDATVDSQAGLTEQRIEVRDDGKSNCLTTVQKDSLVVGLAARIRIENQRELDEKARTLLASCYKGSSSRCTTLVRKNNITWRKLTPLECEKLQTVPVFYTNHVSNSQRYRMLGNGWTVDVIAHIFEHLFLTKTSQD